MNVPFLSFEGIHAPLKAAFTEALHTFLDSNQYVLGQETTRFEEAYATYCTTKHCVGVSNGLDALRLCLQAVGVGFGDEVIVPSHTFIATALAVAHLGATPVFVEPDENTFNINPTKISEAITTKTKAIIPVHLYGQPCEMPAIMDIANSHGLFVIEDNAQAQGATCMGQKTGSFGQINATSFYPSKNLGALGEAGGITTNDSTLFHAVQTLRNYGSSQKYHNESIGYNHRIDELQAAFLHIKLAYLDGWITERQRLASVYHAQLSDIEDLRLPETTTNCTHVYHLFVVRTHRRDALAEHLAQRGITTVVHYPIPPHLQPAFAYLGKRKGDFPIGENLEESVLSLPLFVGMTAPQQEKVCEVIRDFFC